MNPFQYKPPRVQSGDLRTWVKFYEYEPSSGPEPGEQEKSVLYECFAKIDQVWMRDVELAKANGTLSDVTVIIRDPHGDYWPSNKHYIEIVSPEYEGVTFNVRQAQPDMQLRDFINVIAGVTS